MITSLINCLLLTIVIEITSSLIFGIRKKEDIEVVIWVNILTNPVVVYLTNCIKLFNNNYIYIISVLILEIIVVIVEFAIYKRFLEFNKKSPLFISFMNNTISFSLGIIIGKIIF